MDLAEGAPLGAAELDRIDAYWRAAISLSVGQISLMGTPLLREPLLPEHVKPRLLGHWGTTPGLTLIYAHLNRVIAARQQEMIYVTGPGHGGPGLVANVYLEGTYSQVYPRISRDLTGMERLFTQFSFPGGIPSHVAPETPGSIHEGGELGYSLSHAYGAVLDNPDLVAVCVIGDGEAETGPLAASWHSNKFLDPAGDGAARAKGLERREPGGGHAGRGPRAGPTGPAVGGPRRRRAPGRAARLAALLPPRGAVRRVRRAPRADPRLAARRRPADGRQP